MIKKFCLFTIVSFISVISFSQTIKENIRKQSENPQTAENAARADVYIAERKIVSDTANVKPSRTQTPVLKKSRRKKSCSRS